MLPSEIGVHGHQTPFLKENDFRLIGTKSYINKDLFNYKVSKGCLTLESPRHKQIGLNLIN